MKKLLNIFKFLFSRMVIVGLLLLIQVAFMIFFILKLSEYFVYFYVFLVLISVLVVLFIVSKDDNPAYKLAWVIPILVFPLFGGLLYLAFGGNRSTRTFRKKLNRAYDNSRAFLDQDRSILESLNSLDKNVASQAKYILDYAKFPVYINTKTEYLTPGEVKFERMVEELKKAQHYIFLEYFIIEEGIMWNTILDILVDKVKQGVDVRVMYDDVGCLQTLPYNYYQKLKSLGIKCVVFNKFKPLLSVRLNNRDHRKIVIIDGHTAFTGGINLADEYINQKERFGHWKDASIIIQGEAVYNLTVMFLQTWDFANNCQSDFSRYKPEVYMDFDVGTDGFVQPFGDSPLDSEIVSEYAYINMINKAKNYLYINTPYLIVDNEVVTALTLAAKSGVDVRIVTPHHPDKWYVHMVTQAYYSSLIEAGVKIYEYTPGFIHSKTFVSDDETSIVGTINLDFRSLYLHFECGVWMYKSSAVMQVKEDFIKTLEVCKEITYDDCKKIKKSKRLLRAILRAFAPLM